MKRILRNSIAVIVGLVIGSFVNMGLILLGPNLIPPPVGVDVNNLESMRAGIHLFEPKHFLFPFLAHAVGTLVGAIVAFVLAVGRSSLYSGLIGILFLAGGIAASLMIPAPGWFITLDLTLAYLPMAWIGGMIGGFCITKEQAKTP